MKRLIGLSVLLWPLFLFKPVFAQLEAKNWVSVAGTFEFLGPANFNFNPLLRNRMVGWGNFQQQPFPVANSCDGKLLFFEVDSNVFWRHLSDSLGNKLANSDSFVYLGSGPGLISKISLNEDLYLFFSRYDQLHFSRIEKNQISGNYSVTQKNIPIDTTSGGFVVVKHANGFDKWLIIVQRRMSRYKVYHINTSGTITYHSTLSHPRFYDNNFTSSERLTVSADGTKVVGQNLSNNLHFELLNFDPGTGQLFSPIFIPPIRNVVLNPIWAYIRVFSPDGSKLYTLDPTGISVVQFDLTVLDSATIDQSRQRISSSISLFSDITIAPDGSLYLIGRMGLSQSLWTPPHVLNFSRIRYPDLPYPACLFEDTVFFTPPVNIPNSGLQIQMPRFPMYYFYPGRFSVVANDVCLGDTARMRLYDYDNLNSVRWDFGDPTSPNNTDTVFAPVHFYNQPGTYTITAIADYCNKLDTLTKTIRVWGFPESPNLPDTVLCAGSSLPVALVPDSVLSIRWSNGDSLWSTSFNTGGWQWAELSNTCFSTRDSFYITLHEPPQSGLLSDTNVCAGTSLTLTPQPGDYTWQWQDGSTQPLTVTEAGTFALLMTNACGTFVHEVRVDYQQGPELNLTDTSRCEGQFYRIELPEVWQGSYQWTDGSSERIRILTDSGWYSAEVSNPCGTTNDQFYLGLADCECHMYLPTAFSPNGDGLNDELIIKTRCELSSYQMEVYDRWGRQIFTSNNLNRGWDGTFQGQDVPNGSYPFIIRYTPEGRNPRVEKGVVNVLR